jgi:5-methylcytosine-specific restriction endonuclease McrA
MKATMKCQVCGKEFTYETIKGITRKYCSRKCMYNFRKGKSKPLPLNHPFFNKGEEHPSYKNGNGRGYNYTLCHPLSIKLLGNNCQICGTAERVITHHKDSNPRNNPLNGSNWQRLCNSCHKKLHWEPKKRFKNAKEASRFHYSLQKFKRKTLIENAMYKKFGTRQFITTKVLSQRLSLSRERIRQYRNRDRLDYVKVEGSFFYPASVVLRPIIRKVSSSKFRKLYGLTLEEISNKTCLHILKIYYLHESGQLAELLAQK